MLRNSTESKRLRPAARPAAILIFWSFALPLFAVEPERDFSGNWILVESRSSTTSLGAESEPFLTVAQDDRSIRCKSALGGSDVSWTFTLDGRESRYKTGAESRNALVKWEGAALLVNTLVSGAQNYTVMDRWRLSPDRATLTITRQIVRGARETEGRLVFRRAGARSEEAPRTAQTAPTREPSSAAPERGLSPRPSPAPAASSETIVRAGTRILLELSNPLNTKRSRDGDKVYLRTAFPVAVDNRVIIPKGSTVIGTVVENKTPKGKGDLYIRFDSLTLPDGETRDLQSRPEGSGEGKIAGSRDSGGDARTVAAGAGIGASIGGIAGAAAGHAGAGLGIGGLAGAAGGLAKVMSKRRDVTLPSGTTVEMVLDRDLRF
jgi:type IV secretion system protein VirB10